MSTEEFQEHLFGAINSAAKSGVHPAIMIAALETAKFQIIQSILKMPPDGEPPEPPERSRILKPPGM